MNISYQFIMAYRTRQGKIYKKGEIVSTQDFTKNDIITFRLLLNSRLIRVVKVDGKKITFPNNNEIATEKNRQDKVLKEELVKKKQLEEQAEKIAKAKKEEKAKKAKLAKKNNSKR